MLERYIVKMDFNILIKLIIEWIVFEYWVVVTYQEVYVEVYLRLID